MSSGAMCKGGLAYGLIRRREYRARIYQQDYFVVQNLSRYLKARLQQLLRHGAAVADVGCGEQPLRPLIELTGATYTGIDIAQNSRRNVETIGSITKVPLADASFDLVLCTEVLEHVPDTRGAFRELARLVRRGGHILMTVPFSYPLHEEPHDYVRLTEYQVKCLAGECGLEVIELARLGDELQVLATVWCNMWSWGTGSEPDVGWGARKVWGLTMRLPMNLLVSIGSALFGKILPRKQYLSTVSVLRKPDAPA